MNETILRSIAREAGLGQEDAKLLAAVLSIGSDSSEMVGDRLEELLTSNDASVSRWSKYICAELLADRGAHQRALELAESAALSGLSTAALLAGILHAVGSGAVSDIVASRRYFQLAAQLGNPSGYFQLGCTFQLENGSWTDPKSARDAFEHAYALGHEFSGSFLGGLLLDSTDIVDQQRGFELLVEAAKQDDFLALWRLGVIYRDGIGVAVRDTYLSEQMFARAMSVSDEWHAKLKYA